MAQAQPPPGAQGQGRKYAWGDVPRYALPHSDDKLLETHVRKSNKRMSSAELNRRMEEERATLATALFELEAEVLPVDHDPPGFLWSKRDWGFFAALMSLGLVFIRFAEDDVFEGGRLFGQLLFNGALPPLLLSVWALLTGAVLFRVQNTIKCVVAAVLLNCGIVLLALLPPTPSDEQPTLNFNELIGTALFEIGILFFVTKLCLLAEDSEHRIARLEKSLKEARESPAGGLALSYFYNFVKPTAANLRHSSELHDVPSGDGSSPHAQNLPQFARGDTPIDMEQTRGVFETYACKHSVLVILVPRDLVERVNIKSELARASREGVARQGRPLPRSDETHRPMFVYFLSSNSQDRTCGPPVDVPTIVSSLLDRALAQEAQLTEDEKAEKVEERVLVNRIEVWRELVMFQNKLLQLVKSDRDCAGCVRIVSVPPPPFDFETLKECLEQAPRPPQGAAKVPL